MAAPLRGVVRDPGAPTINAKKTMTTDPLGGGARDPGAPTINVRNIDGGAPRRQCRRSGSTHHQCKKLMAGPLGGADGDPGVPTINEEKHRQRAPQAHVVGGGVRSPSGIQKVCCKPVWV
jgi:hypothetical protein